MKSVYIPSLVAFVVGSGLLMTSAASTTELSVLGFTLVSPVVRGLGIIVLIFGAIAFLAAYGSTLPPRRQEPPRPVGDTPKKNEDPTRHRHLSHRA